MEIREFKYNDQEKVVDFFNRNCFQSNYCAIDESLFEHPDFDSKGLLLALEQEKIIGMSLGVIPKTLLPNETINEVPGYLSILLVDKKYQKKGIGNCLLERELLYFKKNKRKTVRFSHRCPIKFSWKVNSLAQHNKAPGVQIESDGYHFLINRGFYVLSNEISYFCDLKNFSMDKMLETKKICQKKGYQVCYFDSSKHIGYEEMFTRLEDESYRKKFHDGISNRKKMLVCVKDDKEVVGVAGVIYPEKNGRGFFQGLAVDPKHMGNKLGNLLFFSLCDELKKLGASYMTIFVTEDNFARKIYEKAGFVVVKKWAILERKI